MENNNQTAMPIFKNTESGLHKKKKIDSEPIEPPMAKKTKVESFLEDELKAKENNMTNAGSGTNHKSKVLI